MSILRTLINADECCAPCGQQYGTARPGDHGHWPGVCPICRQDAELSSTRRWGYLRRGVQELTAAPPADPVFRSKILPDSELGDCLVASILADAPPPP